MGELGGVGVRVVRGLVGRWRFEVNGVEEEGGDMEGVEGGMEGVEERLFVLVDMFVVREGERFEGDDDGG